MAKCGKGYQMTLSWVPIQGGQLPPNAIEAEHGVFVCRGTVSGDVVPGKYVRDYFTAYVPHGGREHELQTCEVLCDSGVNCKCKCYEWEKEEDGKVPKKAIVASVDSNGDPQYIAKAVVRGETCVGKVHEGHDCAYFPHGGEEVSESKYEVLVWVMK